MRTSLYILQMALGLAGTLEAQSRVVVAPPHGLVGRWQMCIQRATDHESGETVPHCGRLTVLPDSFPAHFQYSTHYAFKVRYASSLRSSTGQARTVGGIRTAMRDSVTVDSSAFVLQLGSEGGYDNGSLIVRLTWSDPDRLEGPWQVTCYNPCPATGRLTLQRTP